MHRQLLVSIPLLLWSCGTAEKAPSTSASTPSGTTPGSGTVSTSTACTPTWFTDADGDGFGDPLTGSCTPGTDLVQDATDCDDTNDAIYPDADELCDGLDNNCDSQTDELFDDLDGDAIADCEETLLFCEDFEGSLKSWGYLGTGEWLQQYGAIHEERGGAYGAVMYTNDSMGRHDVFRMEVRTAFTGSLNDLAGLVWSVDPDASTYLVARWDDPQNDYGRHQPPGAIQVVECTDEVTCPIIAQDPSHPLFWEADGTFVTWSVVVDHGQTTVTWDGQVVFDQYVYAADGRGPGRVGLYSNDNDGGVQFDDFCLWVTPQF